jgi:hypothetical protein
MLETAGPFPRADAVPTQPQSRPGKHCVASTRGRSMLEAGNGRLWGGEASLRLFLHWQCQLGTVPYTVQLITVITVNNGPLKLQLRFYLRNYGTFCKKRNVPYTVQCTGPVHI